MSGTLFVVATPIGNLEDITLRALRVLREADLIAAEDTRRTARLLAAHAISTRTVSFHEHNTRTRIPQLVAHLRGGRSVALVTDAGTPGISDPGVELVRVCIDADIAVEPIPGASASLAAAVASGFPLSPMTVFGFPPARSKDRIEWIKNVSSVPHTMTFFEAPHRISSTLAEAVTVLGNRPIVVAKELTKMHQSFLRGSASEVLAALSPAPKGEYTVVIGPMTNLNASAAPSSDEDVSRLFGQIAKSGALTRREALSATAKHLGLSAREVYAAIERGKK